MKYSISMVLLACAAGCASEAEIAAWQAQDEQALVHQAADEPHQATQVLSDGVADDEDAYDGGHSVVAKRNWWWGTQCVAEQSDWDACNAAMGDICAHGVAVTAYPSLGQCHARCTCADENGRSIGGVGIIVDSVPI